MSPELHELLAEFNTVSQTQTRECFEQLATMMLVAEIRMLRKDLCAMHTTIFEGLDAIQSNTARDKR